MAVQLETQEAGTGTWFPVVIYSHGNERQRDDAAQMADTLRAIGLHARITEPTNPRADLVTALERHAEYRTEDDDRLWIPVELAADIAAELNEQQNGSNNDRH